MEHDMSHETLTSAAREATHCAHAPYSGYHVGAALLCTDRTIFTGCNVENATYGATICAEQVAVCKAVSEGYRDFAAIAIAARRGDEWLTFTPCGICRQVLAEFCGVDMLVLVCGETEVTKFRLGELLPEGFAL